MIKRTLILLFLLTLFKYSFEQTDTLKFKQFGDTSEFSELNLNPNRTFAFHYRNTFSCWMWGFVYGTWKIKNNKIVFTDTIHDVEDDIRFDTSTNNKTDYISITVKTDYGKPLPGIKINYALRNSYFPGTYVTDKNGQIKINKDIFAKQKSTNPSDNEVSFIIHFSNKKYPERSLSTSFDTANDKIDITVVDNPRIDLVIRTTTYSIDGNEIYFENQTYINGKGFGLRSWGNFRAIAGRISAITMN